MIRHSVMKTPFAAFYADYFIMPYNTEKFIEKCRMMGQKDSETDLLDLSDFISDLCNALEQPLVLMIDEGKLFHLIIYRF